MAAIVLILLGTGVLGALWVTASPRSGPWVVAGLVVLFGAVEFGPIALGIGTFVVLAAWIVHIRPPLVLAGGAALAIAFVGPAGELPSVAAPAPPASGGTLPAEPVTPASWAQALLARLGDQATPEDMRAVTAWERAEGGNWANDARFNPLNTTQREPGARPINSVGVEAYTSWDQGLTATVSTLQNGRYEAVLSALAAGDCAPCVADAVGASPWGTGRFPT